MDNREIARALGRTDGATKVLLHRAIRQLEGIVADRAGGDTAGEGSSHNGKGPE
jgi:RNA polymerase sigma-70 factor (ECF subfamily)